MDEQMVEIEEYEAPRIVDYGDLVELTAASTGGENLDMDYPRGTPRGSLGFS